MKRILLSLLLAASILASIGRLDAQDSPSLVEGGEVKVMSPAVIKLIDAYEREKERVLAPLDANFDRALSDLKASFVTVGDLNGALAVDALIRARAERDGSEKEVSDIPIEQKDTHWKWGTGGELVIFADGTAKHSTWERAGIWEKKPDGSLELLSETGLHSIEFLEDGTAIVKGRIRDTTLTPIE